jgi:AcrR family transcriptional regulator
MTEKQEKIVRAALELFAMEGFSATSTSKIAKKAGVSEGLIFRHFCNKEGLLKAILNQGEEKAKMVFADIVMEIDPKEVIRKTLNLSKTMIGTAEDISFWKLQYKIKWEVEQYNKQKMEPLEMALSNAFEKLGYEDAAMEAQLLMLQMDGIVTRFFLQKDFAMKPVLDYLRKKYSV